MKILGWILSIGVLLGMGYIYTQDITPNIQRLSNVLPTTRTIIVPRLDANIDLSLTSPDRDLNKLTSDTKILAQEFLALARSEGYYLFITEGYRSLERQQALYDQGRTQAGNKVTRTMNSRHLSGIAFDVAFDPKKHGSAYPEDPALREAIGEIGESLGLIRGGRWRRPDKPHFQNGR